MSDKVSVIIPTYKRAKYLTRAIDSILNQTYHNIELIIVDDNDPDTIYRQENEKIMKKYQRYNNIIYIKHSKNQNGSVARNTGIKLASGEFITFLDDDDFFVKDRIEKMVEILKHNEKYDCAYSSCLYIKKGEVVLVKEAIKSGNLLFDVLSQNSFFGTGSNMFFRKEVIEKIGMFDESFIRHQDMEYMARFFEYGNIINLNEILVIKCIDDRQNRPNFENMKKAKEIFIKKFQKNIDKFPIGQKEYIYFSNYFELLSFAKFNSLEYKKIRERLLNLTSIHFNQKKKIYNYEIKQRIKILNNFIEKKKEIQEKKKFEKCKNKREILKLIRNLNM